MRILLDNCVPADLAPHLRGHAVAAAATMGWADLDDGPLLDAMAGHFDVLLTVDHSMPFQQLIANRPLSVVVLHAPSNRVRELARLIPGVQRVLKVVAPGEVRHVPPG